MYRLVVFLVALSAVYGDRELEPPKFFCGIIPDLIYTCLNSPKVRKELALHCYKYESECAKSQCIFRDSGWLNGTDVDIKKVIAYFDQFASDHPEWFSAVQYVKEDCMAKGLLPQGIVFDCPPYDIVQCARTTFIKNAPPFQWSTSEKCAYSRAYASACPVCPRPCYAPYVPPGTCHACSLVTHTPSSIED